MHTSEADRERMRSEAPQTTPNPRSNLVGLVSNDEVRCELGHSAGYSALVYTPVVCVDRGRSHRV